MLAISGSPRQGGNSETLLDRFARGALSAGAEVEKLRVCDLEISPCRECQGCAHDGICVIGDDLAKVERRILDADKMVVASPVFFYGLPAQLKAVIDRGQALWERRRLSSSPLRPPLEIFVLMAGATRGKKLFEGSLLTLRYFSRCFNGVIAGSLLVREVDEAGEIASRPQILEAAFEAGKKFAGG